MTTEAHDWPQKLGLKRSQPWIWSPTFLKLRGATLNFDHDVPCCFWGGGRDTGGRAKQVPFVKLAF